MDNKEYKLLGVISLMFKVFGVIALTVGLVSCVAILIGGTKTTPPTPKLTSLIWLIGGVFYSTLFVMFSEIIKLLVRIEQNTRK